jgi:hypothetical protein
MAAAARRTPSRLTGLRFHRSGEASGMKRLAGLLVCVVSLALAPPALADAIYLGATGQGRTAKIRTGDDGRVERFAIKWRAPCERRGTFFVSGTQTTPQSPFEVNTRRRFVDVGGYREQIEDGMRAVHRARTVGNRVSGRRWRGIFRIRTTVLRGARVMHRCFLRTRWHVVKQG